MRTLLYILLMTLAAGFIPPHLARKDVARAQPPEGEPDDRPKTYNVVEKVGEMMGFPPKQKWKGVRIAAYSIAAGALLRQGVDGLTYDLDHLNDLRPKDLMFLDLP